MLIQSIKYQCYYDLVFNLCVYIIVSCASSRRNTLLISPFSDSLPPRNHSASRDSNNSRHTGSRCLIFCTWCTLWFRVQNHCYYVEFISQTIHTRQIYLHIIYSSHLIMNILSWTSARCLKICHAWHGYREVVQWDCVSMNCFWELRLRMN